MKYFTKLADVYYFGPRAQKNRRAKSTATGLFIGAGPDDDYAARRAALLSVVENKKGAGTSLPEIREEYLKKYPSDFTTMVVKVEAPPIIGAGARKKRFEKLSKNPRIFLKLGPKGGYYHTALHREVMRGKSDEEVVSPPRWNKKRIVVT